MKGSYSGNLQSTIIDVQLKRRINNYIFLIRFPFLTPHSNAASFSYPVLFYMWNSLSIDYVKSVGLMTKYRFHAMYNITSEALVYTKLEPHYRISSSNLSIWDKSYRKVCQKNLMQILKCLFRQRLNQLHHAWNFFNKIFMHVFGTCVIINANWNSFVMKNSVLWTLLYLLTPYRSKGKMTINILNHSLIDVKASFSYST